MKRHEWQLTIWCLLGVVFPVALFWFIEHNHNIIAIILVCCAVSYFVMAYAREMRNRKNRTQRWKSSSVAEPS